MIFSSLIFLFLFLPSVKIAYFSCYKSIQLQNFILMLFSLSFYYWGEKNHIIIMLFCIGINYLAGISLEEIRGPWLRRAILFFAIIVSLGTLGYYKYFNFFINTTKYFFNINVTDIAHIVLPLGISFYTFHALSYVIDVYNRQIKPEYNLIIFTCYVSLFPQLVAGPIVRYRDIQRSFYRRYITRAGLRNGILRFSFGLGKKVLIANTVAVAANQIFLLPLSELNFATAWLGAVAYTLQIYFDFSGYSDMAIGLGLMFGFRYKENFKFPYKSLSIQEFWRRWHISLSSWFRDYVYIPLGGSHKSEVRTYFNLIAIFLLCGLWHGANYTFVVWGLFHGFFLVLERTTFGSWVRSLSNFSRHCYVMFVVTIGWVFFKEESLHDALVFVKTMLIPQGFSINIINYSFNLVLILALVFGILLSFGLNEYTVQYLKLKRNGSLITGHKQLSMLASMLIFITSITALSNNAYNPFLYFRF